MTQRRVLLLGWLAAVSLALAVVARAHYTADLSAFLPASPTAAQQLLIEQLREGPASRLILVAIEGADATTRAGLSADLSRELAGDARLRLVANGANAATADEQSFVFRNRYLLSSRIDAAFFRPDALRARVAANLEAMSSSVGLIAGDLLARDPTGETLQVLMQMTPEQQPAMADGVWVSRDGARARLVVQTAASGSDTDAQLGAIRRIRSAFERVAASRDPGPRGRATLQLTGPPVFAVDARERIQREAMRLSLASSALIGAFLLLVYRSVGALLLGMLPVVIGGLAGVAAVALGFGVVHGVTLGFGVTLIGESVDYSIYLLIQGQRRQGAGRDNGDWAAAFWPTVRLGMLTSVVGFATLLPSSFPGLAQLGCYSIAGLVVASLVTRFLLPALLPSNLRLADVAPLGRMFIALIDRARAARAVLMLIPLVAAFALWTHRATLWNTELASLSPVSAADRDYDAGVRADLGAPDVRTIVVAQAASQDGALAAAEAAAARLQPLVERGVIGGYETPTNYLPSRRAQAARRLAIPPDAKLRAAFREAVAPLPIREEMLQGFYADLQAARSAPDLTLRDLRGTRLAAAVDALLIRHGERWNALLPLRAPGGAGGSAGIDVAAVAAALGTGAGRATDTLVLDLKRESDTLYAGYLAESIRLSLAGLAAIVVLLAATLRSATRVARILAPLVLSVLSVVTVFALGGHAMTILNLVGLLLIVAVGSNYALFYDRSAAHDGADAQDRTVASLVVANITTVTGFGVLAFSSVPVLSAVGMTVAPGALLALVYSALLAGRRGRARSALPGDHP